MSARAAVDHKERRRASSAFAASRRAASRRVARPLTGAVSHSPLSDDPRCTSAGYFWLDTSLQAGIDAMMGALKLHGIPFHFVRAPGARHNERAWGKRVDRPLRFLYGRAR